MNCYLFYIFFKGDKVPQWYLEYNRELVIAKFSTANLVYRRRDEIFSWNFGPKTGDHVGLWYVTGKDGAEQEVHGLKYRADRNRRIKFYTFLYEYFGFGT